MAPPKFARALNSSIALDSASAATKPDSQPLAASASRFPDIAAPKRIRGSVKRPAALTNPPIAVAAAICANAAVTSIAVSESVNALPVSIAVATASTFSARLSALEIAMLTPCVA
jgi:hypothetical protein